MLFSTDLAWINHQPVARWWFQIFCIFTPTWGRFPTWLVFFRWVETTNQVSVWSICFKKCAKINTLQLVARVLLFNGVHPDVVEAVHVLCWNFLLGRQLAKTCCWDGFFVFFLEGIGQHAHFWLMERAGASGWKDRKGVDDKYLYYFSWRMMFSKYTWLGFVFLVIFYFWP